MPCNYKSDLNMKMPLLNKKQIIFCFVLQHFELNLLLCLTDAYNQPDEQT